LKSQHEKVVRRTLIAGFFYLTKKNMNEIIYKKRRAGVKFYIVNLTKAKVNPTLLVFQVGDQFIDELNETFEVIKIETNKYFGVTFYFVKIV
jgi:diphthamide synthase (EF-2-diphthine--ammonia ligase)